MAPPTNTESPSRPFALRSYLAGAGVTVALIAGAVIVFLSAAAFVAFKGMPFASSNSDQGTIAIASGNAPETAAARAAKAGRSVAPKAAAISPAAAAEIASANGVAAAAGAKKARAAPTPPVPAPSFRGPRSIPARRAHLRKRPSRPLQPPPTAPELRPESPTVSMAPPPTPASTPALATRPLRSPARSITRSAAPATRLAELWAIRTSATKSTAQSTAPPARFSATEPSPSAVSPHGAATLS